MRLPGALLPPLGMAGMIVVAVALALSDATAQWITPVIAAAGIAGLTLLPGRLNRDGFHLRLDWFAPAAGVLVFAAYAAPFVASGSTTLGGYVRLDDTASWLAIADWVAHHGVHLSGLQPSTYQLTLSYYLGSDYPVGGLVPLMIGDRVFSTNLAWLYQPAMAVILAMLGLALYAMTERAIRNRALRMLAAFVASQAAVLFGYVLWGGFKEPATAAMIALVAALAIPTLAASPTPRRALPVAVAAAAVIAVSSIGGAVWLVPVLLATLLVDRSLRRPVIVTALALILSVPSLTRASFLDSVAGSTLQVGSRIGNLVHPLNILQIFGVWPVGDFRFTPHALTQTFVIIAIVGLAAIGGLVATVRDRDWTLVIYGVPVLVGCGLVVALGSGWLAAKALTVASPVPVLGAFIGAAALLRNGRRVESVALVAVISGGVLWSNVLAYGDVALAPHTRFDELASIGKRIAGHGPTLMTEYEPYGVRWFLRDAAPEAASELRSRLVPLTGGRGLVKGETADINAFNVDGILAYRTLVLRRSPAAGRPPSPYRLILTGRYYEVWQRPVNYPRVVAQILTPTCSEIRQLSGTLVGAVAPAAIVTRSRQHLQRRPDRPLWHLAGGLVWRSRERVRRRQASREPALRTEPQQWPGARRQPRACPRGPHRPHNRAGRRLASRKRHRAHDRKDRSAGSRVHARS